jgi:hypothetical protein
VKKQKRSRSNKPNRKITYKRPRSAVAKSKFSEDLSVKFLRTNEDQAQKTEDSIYKEDKKEIQRNCAFMKR